MIIDDSKIEHMFKRSSARLEIKAKLKIIFAFLNIYEHLCRELRDETRAERLVKDCKQVLRTYRLAIAKYPQEFLSVKTLRNWLG